MAQRRGQHLKSIAARIGAANRVHQVLQPCGLDLAVHHVERLPQVRQNLRFGSYRIWAARVRVCRRLFAAQLLSPCLIASRHMLYLFGKSASIGKGTLGRFKPPIVFRHGFGEAGKIPFRHLPHVVHRVGNVLRLRRGMLPTGAQRSEQQGER